MIAQEEIIKTINPKIKEMGGYLVDVKVNTANSITVYIDSFKGVLLEDCLQVSKYFEDQFDREIEDYALTVCSPGLSNPFKIKDQYINNQGKEVTVKKNDGKRISGILKKYDKQLTLEVRKKKKGSKSDYIINDIIIPFEQIKETKLKINFK